MSPSVHYAHFPEPVMPSGPLGKQKSAEASVMHHTARSSYSGVGKPSGVKRTVEEHPVSHLRVRCVESAASRLILFLLFAGSVNAGVPGSTSPINVDLRGLALRGYDPVAYFEDRKPTRGVENFSASYGGARYLFASESHRKLFLEDPKKYVPEYGGFCAVGTSFGEKVDVDPETGKIVNGKLYLNNGPKALEIFEHDTRNTISRANQNWPTVKDKAL